MVEPRVGRDHEDVRITKELDRVERPLLEREIAERQVELAALDEREKLAIVRGFGQRELHLRPLTDEAAHQLREDALAHALEDTDAQRTGLAVAEGVQIRLRCRDA